MSRRLGRRGALLLILGTVWLLIGGTDMWTSLHPVRDVAQYGPTLAQALGGGVPYAVGWLLTGAAAFVYAWAREQDTIGYTAVVIMPVANVVGYIIDWVLFITPGGEPGNPRGLVSAAVWALVAGIVIIVAGWRDSSQRGNGDG